MGGAGSHGTYEMTTRVDQPHSLDLVAALMHPSGELLITASLDSSFKIWQIKPGATHWECRSVGFYRGSPVRAAAPQTPREKGITRHP